MIQYFEIELSYWFVAIRIYLLVRVRIQKIDMHDAGIFYRRNIDRAR